MAKRRYNNLDNVSTDKTLKQFRQLREERRRKKKDYSFVIPNMEPDLEFLRSNRKETTLTWIGHSTFFIQYKGLNIVTDPVWALRMGFQRRIGLPGVPIQEVPEIDLILISHSHYDHMHVSSIRRLYGPNTDIIVPAGLKRKLERKGFKRCHEMNWWERLPIKGIELSFVPTQHWTRRTPFDTNSSHWGGFILEPGDRGLPEQELSPGQKQEDYALENNAAPPQGPRGPAQPEPADGLQHSERRPEHPLAGQAGRGLPEEAKAPKLGKTPVIYFAGDSGYFNGFKEIGNRYDIDLALIPIGAYEPEWFMTPQHTTPEEGIQAFLDVKASKMVPMHYGTFRLADDTAREALDRLEQERLKRGIPEEDIRVMIHGETLRL
ncbi:MBL fold metallo-hydrolase [Paenibacillus yonginensis]|uniref:MBL fold metallo-hydrolase n=1 Tax=Paenibacillus yonginensis TaxID=1462996 RepID=A0A1B1N356_9BACL|nr:MBL fold metallo-hydrolase [Paenibacillus yonginensis]ANS75836.1 MBL fold metallo-hydrolase [Paenibacillus yonginensis]